FLEFALTFAAVCAAGKTAHAALLAVRAYSQESTTSNGKLQPPVTYATDRADETGATHVEH
ncbi:hypothetical protein RA268_29805, partial [Pseudomonas syringae pv. tagetis]